MKHTLNLKKHWKKVCCQMKNALLENPHGDDKIKGGGRNTEKWKCMNQKLK